MAYRSSRTILLLLSLVFIMVTALSQHQSLAQEDDKLCFTETRYCIEGPIRDFWELNGGLPVFGLPITRQQPERIESRTLEVQWFERNRLEVHPDNPPPYDVMIGRLGADVLSAK
ncbi:MAG: class F sortase, partial [Chloroflexaceae bacterium]|nr:class F sortase [Chloroflexaceae bacterium]